MKPIIISAIISLAYLVGCDKSTHGEGAYMGFFLYAHLVLTDEKGVNLIETGDYNPDVKMVVYDKKDGRFDFSYNPHNPKAKEFEVYRQNEDSEVYLRILLIPAYADSNPFPDRDTVFERERIFAYNHDKLKNDTLRSVVMMKRYKNGAVYRTQELYRNGKPVYKKDFEGDYIPPILHVIIPRE